MFKIHDVWPAFMVLVLFFISGQNVNSFKSIFCGGAVGILLAAGLIIGIGTLVPMGVSQQAATLGLVGLIIFLLIALSGVANMFFNNYGFIYFTIACIYAAKQDTVTWLLVMLVGGALLSAAVIFSIKGLESLTKKNAPEKKAEL